MRLRDSMNELVRGRAVEGLRNERYANRDTRATKGTPACRAFFRARARAVERSGGEAMRNGRAHRVERVGEILLLCLGISGAASAQGLGAIGGTLKDAS